MKSKSISQAILMSSMIASGYNIFPGNRSWPFSHSNPGRSYGFGQTRAHVPPCSTFAKAQRIKSLRRKACQKK
jgi:hypothetical protein